VRQEYAHVAKVAYRVGRTQVLKGLLAHPRLYLTDYYYQRLEAQARKNIRRELTLLAA
jgi:predicted metal-dependent HD superfamily phosphohydrolase